MVVIFASLLMYFNKLASVSTMQFSAINDFFSEKIWKIYLQIEAGGGKRGKAREGGKEGGLPFWNLNSPRAAGAPTRAPARPGPPPAPRPIRPPSQSPKGARVATDNANARAALSALMVANTSAAKYLRQPLRSSG